MTMTLIRFVSLSMWVLFAPTLWFSCSKDNEKKVESGNCGLELYQKEFNGKATYYNTSKAHGSCMIEFPSDKMYGAMNAKQYSGSDACGAYAEVTNEATGKTIVIQIVDLCPECPEGNIDLSADAFAALAPLKDGTCKIKWHYVKCPDDRQLKVRYKKGSNQWWTAVQILDHKYMIRSVEAKNAKGEFVPMERKSYNYFVDSNGIKDGKPADAYELRITDVAGHVITGVYEHKDDVILPADQQFEDCVGN